LIEIHNRLEWGGTVLRQGTLDLDASGRLFGKIAVSFRGQEALSRRKAAKERDLDETRRREDLEDTIKGWLIDGARVELLNVSGWKETEEFLIAEFSIEILDFAALTPRRLLVPATVFGTHRLLRSTMQHATRVYPFYFPYPWQEEDDITILMPAGTELDALPKDVKTGANLARYERSYEQEPGSLRMRRLLALDGILYPKTDVLREFFERVRTGDENLAVLRKLESKEGGR
jgi:hypothetical protein